jgi:hypothetical protein
MSNVDLKKLLRVNQESGDRHVRCCRRLRFFVQRRSTRLVWIAGMAVSHALGASRQRRLAGLDDRVVEEGRSGAYVMP